MSLLLHHFGSHMLNFFWVAGLEGVEKREGGRHTLKAHFRPVFLLQGSYSFTLVFPPLTFLQEKWGNVGFSFKISQAPLHRVDLENMLKKVWRCLWTLPQLLPLPPLTSVEES